MQIDTHVHVVAADRNQYPLAPATGFRAGGLGPWHEQYPVTAEQLIETITAAGVDRAIVVQPFSAYGFDNSYHADSAARYPERLIGVCTVDPVAADGPERLAFWIKQRGMQGLRLTSNQEGARLDDPRAYPVWEEARALGIPICVLTSPAHLADVRSLAARFPTVPVALDHVAGAGGGRSAEVMQQITDLAALPNVYIKVSTVNFAPLRAEAGAALDQWRQLAARFGAERLLWGSNYPVSQEGRYADMAALGRTALPFLSASERESMLSGTALSLWPSLN